MSGDYKLIIADSIKYLGGLRDHTIPCVVTGLPDIEELKLKSVDQYLQWFQSAAKLIFQKTSIDGYVFFIQTDRKIEGAWIDKSYYLTKVADNNGWRLMWHKLCLNRPVGSANLHRPTYSHILCYSINGRPGNGLPDVVEAEKTDRIYENSTPLVALDLVMKFLDEKRNKLPKSFDYQIVDPFVGRGSVIYMSLEYGFRSLGIDIDKQQIEYAQTLLEGHTR